MVRDPNLTLSYDSSATKWVEALPLGNGRLGAMVFGGAAEEQLQLNENTLWAGGPHDYTNPDGLAALPEIRRLAFEGKIAEAQRLVNATFIGKPARQAAYQTVGDLFLHTGHAGATGYERRLDLDTATVTSSYEAGGVRYRREAFASAPDQVIVMRLSADKKGAVSFAADFRTPQKATVSALTDQTLMLSGTSGDWDGIPGKVRFVALVRAVVHGGTSTAADGKLVVSGADEVVLFVSIATGYRSYQDVDGDAQGLAVGHLDAAVRKSFTALRDAHIRDYQRLFHRVSLDLGHGPAESETVPKRVLAFHEGKDPGLAALYFQYGRYLLISCSRPGGQPATLQGLWNDSMSPPWQSKYTVNINTEMNYWPAEVANLGECHEPLADMVSQIAVTGAKTAKVQYGAGGWVCHHNTDAWRGTAPVDYVEPGMWQTGGAWLSLHLWEMYRFRHDKKALQRHYPILRGAAEFFLDSLVHDPAHGWLVTNPSVSPENSHHPGLNLCAGPSMDSQILHDLFDAVVEASTILGTDPEFRDRVRHAKAGLAPMQIGKDGQLQEWLEDWDSSAPEVHHRHVSHLYGLYPSHQISPRKTPALFAAARRSLETRGDAGTGWSLGWKINLWARLLDGDHAYRLIEAALAPVEFAGVNYSGGGGTYPNLFDAHPPFQIDGNFGFTSGVAEMLLQSHDGEIHLLPSLPKAWPKGSARGLRARGGFEVDITWEDGYLRSATIRPDFAGRVVVRYCEQVRTFEVEAGVAVQW